MGGGIGSHFFKGFSRRVCRRFDCGGYVIRLVDGDDGPNMCQRDRV